MSNTTRHIAVSASVYLDAEEAQEISNGASWIKTPTENSKALLRYAYEGKERGWVLVGGTVYFFRIKKDGTHYKDEQETPLWRHMTPDSIVRKYRPNFVPHITWTEG